MVEQSGRAYGGDPMEWMQQPVCVVLDDGSFYVGWITGLNDKTLTLAGRKGVGKIKKVALHQSGKPKISAFVPGAPAFDAFDDGGFSPFGFSPQGAGLPVAGGNGAGLGGFMGFMKQAWPGIQIGLGVVRAVMPLMGGFKL